MEVDRRPHDYTQPSVRFAVRLMPRGGADRVDGVSEEGVLQARVAAPAVGGAANGRCRYPSLKHALLGYAVDPIRSAAGHQPDRESDRGLRVVVRATVHFHTL